MASFTNIRTLVFYRSVLVISPFADLTQPKAIFDFIFKGLRRKRRDCGHYFSSEEGALIDQLVKMYSSGKVTDADARHACDDIRAHALRFDRKEAWGRALSLCPQGKVLDCVGVQGFAEAYKRFGSGFYRSVKCL